MEVCNTSRSKEARLQETQSSSQREEHLIPDKKEQKLDNKYGDNKVHLHNLKEVMLESLNYIGFGTFSAVKKGYSNKYKNNVAVKIINIRDKKNRLYIEKYLPQETKLWKELSIEKHENILLIKEHILSNMYLYIITDVIAYGDLENFLLRRPISQCTCKRIAKGITDAVLYCHGKGIAHRDIKPSNILIGEGTTLKLADFTFATKTNPVCTGYCGTQVMLAPEQCSRKPYDPFCSDIWQLGLTFYMILFKDMPYKKQRKKDILNEIKGLRLNHHKGVPLPPIHDLTFECKELLSGMLTIHPSSRLTIEEINLSPWLTATF